MTRSDKRGTKSLGRSLGNWRKHHLRIIILSLYCYEAITSPWRSALRCWNWCQMKALWVALSVGIQISEWPNWHFVTLLSERVTYAMVTLQGTLKFTIFPTTVDMPVCIVIAIIIIIDWDFDKIDVFSSMTFKMHVCITCRSSLTYWVPSACLAHFRKTLSYCLYS